MMGGMFAPTAARVRLISQSPFAEQGFPEPTGNEEDPLARLVAAAAEFVIDKTGYGSFLAVPDGKAPLVENAIVMLTSMYVAQNTAEYLETLADFDLIQSFSAGSYSETRRSADDAAKAKALVAWPPVNAAIVAAMTPEAYDDYMAWLNGDVAPAFSVTEVDWTNRDYDAAGGWIVGDWGGRRDLW